MTKRQRKSMEKYLRRFGIHDAMNFSDWASPPVTAERMKLKEYSFVQVKSSMRPLAGEYWKLENRPASTRAQLASLLRELSNFFPGVKIEVIQFEKVKFPARERRFYAVVQFSPESLHEFRGNLAGVQFGF